MDLIFFMGQRIRLSSTKAQMSLHKSPDWPEPKFVARKQSMDVDGDLEQNLDV